MSTNSLEARVALLERLVAAGQIDETLVPNYLSVDPQTGVTTANFNGVFTGTLILPEAIQSSGVLNATSAVQWQDSNQNIKEYIQGYNASGNHTIYLAVVDGSGGANLIMQTNPGGPTDIEFRANDVAGLNFATVLVLDSSGRSSFVKSGTGVNDGVTLVFGQNVVTVTPGAAGATSQVNYNPSLPAGTIWTMDNAVIFGPAGQYGGGMALSCPIVVSATQVTTYLTNETGGALNTAGTMIIGWSAVIQTV